MILSIIAYSSKESGVPAARYRSLQVGNPLDRLLYSSKDIEENSRRRRAG